MFEAIRFLGFAITRTFIRFRFFFFLGFDEYLSSFIRKSHDEANKEIYLGGKVQIRIQARRAQTICRLVSPK